MAKNMHGIELPSMLGANINRAMFEGNTSFLFMLIADYLKTNELQVPVQITTLYQNENLCEKE